MITYWLEAYIDNYGHRLCRLEAKTPFGPFQHEDVFVFEDVYYDVISLSTEFRAFPDGSCYQITKLMLSFDFQLGPNGKDNWKD